ncbi:hypothetical protein [Nonomuraea sp. NPDC050202]|uniref:hypothetical protein n=1 Tax=Nonomuraea sp. NPDC050202 TaxID=3155035 RepID=UPI0033D19D3C
MAEVAGLAVGQRQLGGRPGAFVPDHGEHLRQVEQRLGDLRRLLQDLVRRLRVVLAVDDRHHVVGPRLAAEVARVGGRPQSLLRQGERLLAAVPVGRQAPGQGGQGVGHADRVVQRGEQVEELRGAGPHPDHRRSGARR